MKEGLFQRFYINRNFYMKPG